MWFARAPSSSPAEFHGGGSRSKASSRWWVRASPTALHAVRRRVSTGSTCTSSVPATRPDRLRCFFSTHARSVTLLCRGAGLERSMSQYLVDQVSAQANVAVRPMTEVAAVAGPGWRRSRCATRRPARPNGSSSGACSCSSAPMPRPPGCRDRDRPQRLRADGAGRAGRGPAGLVDPYLLESAFPASSPADVRATARSSAWQPQWAKGAWPSHSCTSICAMRRRSPPAPDRCVSAIPYGEAVDSAGDDLHRVWPGEPGRLPLLRGLRRRVDDRPGAAEERKIVTVLFADLVGFTSRSERMDVEDVRGTLAPTTRCCASSWSTTAARSRSSSATR